MNLTEVNRQTELLVNAGHRVLQIHRFAASEFSHVKRLLQWGDFPRNAKVLDMGSGTGEMAVIAEKLRPDLDFTLVNISQAQLNYSTKFASFCCDFCSIPLPGEGFDVVMFCFSLGHEDHQKGLCEAYRMLKPGGVLFIYDMLRVAGDNSSMSGVEYSVLSKEEFLSIATKSGFVLDFFLEPFDDGSYGRSVLGDCYSLVFAGTTPAIWRFLKP